MATRRLHADEKSLGAETRSGKGSKAVSVVYYPVRLAGRRPRVLSTIDIADSRHLMHGDRRHAARVSQGVS